MFQCKIQLPLQYFSNYVAEDLGLFSSFPVFIDCDTLVLLDALCLSDVKYSSEVLSIANFKTQMLIYLIL